MLKPKTEAAPAAAETTGRPGPKRRLKGGRRVNVYLDDPTFEAVYAAMNGNKERLSEGLRLAVKLVWGHALKSDSPMECQMSPVSCGAGGGHDEEPSVVNVRDDASLRLWLKERTSPAEE